MGAVVPNGIGVGAIGVMPIGTRPILDWFDTIASQFATSPSLLSFIASASAAIDESMEVDEFFDDVWNLQTASGYGLDVWGRIVGVSRILNVSGLWFGFAEAGPVTAEPFYQAPFYAGPSVSGNFALTDDAYRTLIYAKALANICDGSIPGINQVLLTLFPNRGVCYCEDLGGMAIRYHFAFNLTAVEAAIVQNSGVLPKPVGVSSSVIIAP